MVFSSCPLMRQMLLSVSRAAAAGEAKAAAAMSSGNAKGGVERSVAVSGFVIGKVGWQYRTQFPQNGCHLSSHCSIQPRR